MVAVQVALMLVVTKSGVTTESLVFWAVTEVPVVLAAGLAVGLARSHVRKAAGNVDQQDLVARVERTESALARAQDRLHELRTTLSSLRVSHQLLVDPQHTLPRATRGRLQDLHTAELERIERLLSTVRDENVTDVDLADVLGPLVDVMALRGCTVEWRGTGFPVRGRPDDITEIVHILLDNAARHAAGRDVVLTVTGRGGWVELRVRDGGPGVARPLTPRVFDRGIRAPSSSGEGIGLHVARRLARDLGGDVRLEPQDPSGGAEFVVRLPESTGLPACLAAAG